ncbi:unnamed protein product, partial [Notodromas monacha]
TCFNAGAGYQCDCPHEFFGRNCTEPRLTCLNPPCIRMNICSVPVPSNATGITGHVSMSEYELVPSRICGEHGTCVSSAEKSDEFSCECEPGFTGRYCHINILCCVKSSVRMCRTIQQQLLQVPPV